MYNYFVGIDIAKDDHFAVVLNSSQEIVVPAFSFKNNIEGFEKLKAICSDYSNCLFVMESTGNFHYNLFHYLNHLDFSVALASTVGVHSFRKMLHQSNKTDPLDSILIAKYAATMGIEPTTLNPKDLQELRDITRLKRSYSEDITSIKNRIKSLLQLVFPEYAKQFSSVYGKSALELLKAYPTADKLKSARLSKVTKILRENSRNRYNIKKAEQLIALAKKSSASCFGATYETMMTSLISNLESLLFLIETLDNRINLIMKELNTYLVTIPGIGPTLAAEILAEIGDVKRFASPSQIISYAGLHSSAKQSGYSDSSDSQHITKKGNRHLRRALYTAAEAAAKSDPELKTYYEKKKQEGKHHSVVVIGISRKLTNRIYSILLNNRPYEIRSIESD